MYEEYIDKIETDIDDKISENLKGLADIIQSINIALKQHVWKTFPLTNIIEFLIIVNPLGSILLVALENNGSMWLILICACLIGNLGALPL